MFPWNIAKSAEAMFSRWAVKRVCKFLLKKKLGQFLLGDIDLDQLDVQLAEGTIQLNDLALNVDFLNEKLGGIAALRIKEGSIGSLLVGMPWKGKGCQVEVEELELVLAPGVANDTPSVNEAHHPVRNQGLPSDFGMPDHDMGDIASKSTSRGLHEGVKTIAKIVKWFLTSFNVKIKRVIIAFDPQVGEEKNSFCHQTLVLRISEIECGTCVSEDANQVKVENFLGISQLTNFVKFEGAILEFLQLDDDDNKTCSPCMPTSVTTPIMTGKGGGFSGNIKLSIPWKNGSLDIRRVDSDVFIEPIVLRVQPSTIRWLLLSWEAFKNLEKDRSDTMLHKESDPVHLNSASPSSVPVSDAISTSREVEIDSVISNELSSLTLQESATEALLSASHFISDWVPSTTDKKVAVEEELDFGASVDQFFECFDGMRSSQSALGNSGMWNWTCSVFSAITAASSLATGSLHIPSEQQHVETNLKATLAGVSVFLSFQDEKQKCLFDTDGQATGGSFVPYLGAECKDIFLLMKIRPQEMRYEGTMRHIEIASYLSYESGATELGLQGCNNDITSQNLYVRHRQADVLGALPPRASSFDCSDELNGLIVEDFPFGKKENVVKFTLLKTSGITCCQFTVKSSSSDGIPKGPASFSVELPPFVFWVDFSLINMLLELLKEIVKSVEKQDVFSSKSFDRKHGSSNGEVKRGVTSLSSKESLEGNILILNARVILCFPFESSKDFRGFASWDQFVALDFSLPSSCTGETVQDSNPSLEAATQKRNSTTTSRSFNMKFCNLDIFLVNHQSKDDGGVGSSNKQRQNFSAQNILSVADRTGSLSVISMCLQEGQVTGPWMAKKAKSLATFKESKSSYNFVGKDYEFASASTVKDVEDLNSQTREEIILSSTTFIHISFSATMIKLRRAQYEALCCLIDQIKNELSSVTSNETDVEEASSMSQTSISVECSVLEILISPDVKEDFRGSMQSELPGSWNCLKLQIQKFSLLSVSNIGGIRGANFFWLAHAEGKLLGSVTGVPDEEFLLISCNNSTMRRGDGGGFNALSSRLAGCDIVHLWDPESLHDFTSITVRCGTIIAVGGRLDWLEAISSFFNVPSTETEKEADKCVQKEDMDVSCGASFVLNLVDIGLSYEPYMKSLVANSEVLGSESSSSNGKREMGEEYVACLLAASFLNLSNSTAADSIEKEYEICIQDLGLLLHAVSENENICCSYGAEHLQKIGYVKIAQEALVEATLRTSCKSGLLWELECSKSHIYLETCQDTTSSMICLAAQLQQLFAPDMEESIVHLQNRWKKFQQEQERAGLNDESKFRSCDSASSASEIYCPSVATPTEPGLFGLMDEICEDAFQIDKNQILQYDSDENFLGEMGILSIDSPEIFSGGLYFDCSMPVAGLESSQTSSSQGTNSLEFIEGYYLSELEPFTDSSVGRQSSHDIPKCNSSNVFGGDRGGRNSGWYGDTSLKIVEDHLSEASYGSVADKYEDKLPCMDSKKVSGFSKALGRLLLKNIDVSWRMDAGFDFPDCKKSGQQSTNIGGRDRTACMELLLSGMEFEYEVFPVGEIHVSKLSLSVQDFQLYDMSRDAPWKLVFGHYNSKDHPRESSSKAFQLELESVRPDPLIPLEEYRLRIAFLPIRLHLHQSQLDFLINFFGGKNSSVDQPPGCHQDSDGSKLSSMSTNPACNTIVEEAFLPYFQNFDIRPILVRVDYTPSHVDLAALRTGKYAELVNLVRWKGVELLLKHAHGVGMYGWGSVCEAVLGEWLADISQNQIHKILHGLPTIRSLVAVGAGAAKLVTLPLENYRKDKRVLKGMQRGITAFLRSISLEAVGLGVHLAAGAHDILLQAEYTFSNISPTIPSPVSRKRRTKVRSNQPKDAQEGIQQAYESLSDGLGKSASALVQTPLKKYQRGAGTGSALAAAVRAVPTAAIAPASACASAVHCALLGFRNSLDPERKKESMEKYLGPTQPREQN
ncbi:hypothetical protein UlMin_043388 [Ulmus minor]